MNGLLPSALKTRIQKHALEGTSISQHAFPEVRPQHQTRFGARMGYFRRYRPCFHLPCPPHGRSHQPQCHHPYVSRRLRHHCPHSRSLQTRCHLRQRANPSLRWKTAPRQQHPHRPLCPVQTWHP
ncbi:unnamed protein product [Ixodes hexagonus]